MSALVFVLFFGSSHAVMRRINALIVIISAFLCLLMVDTSCLSNFLIMVGGLCGVVKCLGVWVKWVRDLG